MESWGNRWPKPVTDECSVCYRPKSAHLGVQFLLALVVFDLENSD